ncbi:hypothetical protein ACRAWD_30180 [Caulobacter segnis]
MKLVATVLLAALASTAQAAEAPAFLPVRSDEDYSYLRNVADRTGLDPLRYIPLGDDAYLSLGGEARSAHRLHRRPLLRPGRREG